MKDRIIEMLGRGIPAVQVAAAIGCEDSYISQLLSQPDIAEAVQIARAAHFSAHVEQDDLLNQAEATALAKLTQLAAFVTRPTEAARIYAVLNAAKRRTAGVNTQAAAPAQTISLDLPAAARVSFTVTPDRQVIEIQGRSLTTMPAKSLAAQLEQRNAARLLSSSIPTSLPVLPSPPHRDIAKHGTAGAMQKPCEIPLVEQL